MGITRSSFHKRRATGGKRKPHRKKRKFEMGRPAAATKLGVKRIHLVRGRGGNLKHRALRLDTGNFSWGTEAVTRKTRILSVVYNASNNELVRTNTLVKNSIIQVDATPFRQWYERHYGIALGKKKGAAGPHAKKESKPKAAKAAKSAKPAEKAAKAAKSAKPAAKPAEKKAAKPAAKPAEKAAKPAEKKAAKPAEKAAKAAKPAEKAAKAAKPAEKAAKAAKPAEKAAKPAEKAAKPAEKAAKAAKPAEKAAKAAKPAEKAAKPAKPAAAEKKAEKPAAEKKGEKPAAEKPKKKASADKPKKKKKKAAAATDADAPTKKSRSLLHKLRKRARKHTLETAIEEQFTTGRLYACISSRPGQSGRCDGYILEGKELEFYLRKIHQKKKSAKP